LADHSTVKNHTYYGGDANIKQHVCKVLKAEKY